MNNVVQLNYQEERDWEKLNSSLNALVNEVTGEQSVFQRTKDEYVKELTELTDAFEDFYQDATFTTNFPELPQYRQNVENFEAHIQQTMDDFNRHCRQLFPKPQF